MYVFTRMMLYGATIPGMMYAQNVLVRPNICIFKNHGIRPAWKYMVITRNLYQNFLPHISSLVTRYPINPDAATISAVPSTVLDSDTINALERSLTFNNAV